MDSPGPASAPAPELEKIDLDSARAEIEKQDIVSRTNVVLNDTFRALEYIWDKYRLRKLVFLIICTFQGFIWRGEVPSNGTRTWARLLDMPLQRDQQPPAGQQEEEEEEGEGLEALGRPEEQLGSAEGPLAAADPRMRLLE